MAYLKYIWKLIKDKMNYLDHVVWLHHFCMQTLYILSINCNKSTEPFVRMICKTKKSISPC